MLINRNGEREPSVVSSHHLLKEAFYGRNIAFSRKHKLNRIPFFIQGAVQIFPLLADFDVGLINTI